MPLYVQLKPQSTRAVGSATSREVIRQTTLLQISALQNFLTFSQCWWQMLFYNFPQNI